MFLSCDSVEAYGFGGFLHRGYDERYVFVEVYTEFLCAERYIFAAHSSCECFIFHLFAD